ncbi:DUF2877 domain-containing protein [Nocardioides sp.]|uniref:DUF2877 domain-containing protein n=1 Tax=Nocardioides sp. TaxID=35761 RepID=UPI0039E57C30
MRDRLAAAGDGPLRVVHRGRDAVYLEVDGWCVGVVSGAAAQVPCALRVVSLAGLPGDRAELAGGVLHLDGVSLPIGRIVSTRVPSMPPAPRLPQARHATGRVTEETVARLLGSGDGLTPYGDDVLCGWLALHRAAAVATPEVDDAVRARLHRTTLLSATLLDCAMHGEVLPEFAAWVRSLDTPRQPAAEEALAAIGHTSGRGLLAGGRQALGELSSVVTAA